MHSSSPPGIHALAWSGLPLPDFLYSFCLNSRLISALRVIYIYAHYEHLRQLRTVNHAKECRASAFRTLTSRQNWEWLKSTPPETLTDIQRAARFLYLQKLAFGAKVEGMTFGISATTKPRFNLLTLERDLEACHHRLARTTIEALPWDKCLIRYDREETLFYCDPPYWQTAGYGTEFGWEQYEKLAELSKTIQGKMIISINDHPEIRKLFAHMRVEEVKHSYSVGGGQRTQRCTELVLY